MIDWVTMRLPLTHIEAIHGGHVLSVAPCGSIEWTSPRRHVVRSSADDTLTIRTVNVDHSPLGWVEISGNPVKFFQGHNLWGTDDLHGICVATIRYLVSALPQLQPEPWEIEGVDAGRIHLTRVDITHTYHLDNMRDCLAWIRAAERSASISYRGRGQLSGETLYFGKHSRRWSLKIYSKGNEVKNRPQSAIIGHDLARDYADKSLRIELTLRGMELKRHDLDTVSAFSSSDMLEFYNDRIENLTMTHTDNLVTDTLPPSLAMAYETWRAGHDLRDVVSRASYYRYRRALLAHGIDIRTPPPRLGDNVASLGRVLHARPVGVPDWAARDGLLWEPRHAA